MNVRTVFSIRWVCVSICLLLCWRAPAQTLWQDTRYGMSVEEVRAVVPGVVSPQEPGHLGDGAKELLRLETFELVNSSFQGAFFFSDAKLTQVTLSRPLSSRRAGLLVFNSLTEALRAKYGPELSRESQGDIVHSSWLSDRTNINLFMLVIGDEGFLNLNYQVRLAKEADKL